MLALEEAGRHCFNRSCLHEVYAYQNTGNYLGEFITKIMHSSLFSLDCSLISLSHVKWIVKDQDVDSFSTCSLDPLEK